MRRDQPAFAAPRALDEAAQRRLLRAADNAPVRSRALVVLMLFTALRISETVALGVDDVQIVTRKGALVVIGTGEVQREVPRNALGCARFSTSGSSSARTLRPRASARSS